MTQIYDHSAKAGNEGDVAKHVALLEALAFLSKEWPDQEPFWYLDTHAARAVHRLTPNGEWGKGIGSLSKIHTLPERINEYLGLSFLNKTGFGGQYLGSTAIASHSLHQSLNRMPWLTLCDVNLAACVDLYAYFTTIQAADPLLLSEKLGSSATRIRQVWNSLGDARAMIVNMDGYTIASQLISLEFKPSLVFIDPPTIKKDREYLEPLLDSLHENAVPFVCWTPLMTHGRGADGWQKRAFSRFKGVSCFLS
jgi:23S rRNA A2030 N6-methylase RlmJ